MYNPISAICFAIVSHYNAQSHYYYFHHEIMVEKFIRRVTVSDYYRWYIIRSLLSCRSNGESINWTRWCGRALCYKIVCYQRNTNATQRPQMLLIWNWRENLGGYGGGNSSGVRIYLSECELARVFFHWNTKRILFHAQIDRLIGKFVKEGWHMLHGSIVWIMSQ